MYNILISYINDISSQLDQEIPLADAIILSLSCLGAVYGIALAAFRIATLESENAHEPIINALQSIMIGISSYFLQHNIHKFEHFSKNVYMAKEVVLYSTVLLFIYLLYRTYTRVMGGRRFKRSDLTGKVYIVTGANAGIGYETTKELVRMGATVVMACRSVEKANAAKDRIMRATKSNKIRVMKLDLCGFDSVRKFVKEFKTTGLALHGLINNAGVMMDDRNLTQDGFEMVFTANHLSHFLLTNLLLPDLEKTNGRIVNLTSSLYKLTNAFNFDDVMSVKKYSLFGTYAQSKLANILFTIELQRRLDARGSKVTCNAVHPGAVRTEVTRNMNSIMQLLNWLALPVMLAIQKTPAQGAYCSIFAAIDSSLDGKGGNFFVDSVAYSLRSSALDPIAGQKLWDLSQTLTGLK